MDFKKYEDTRLVEACEVITKPAAYQNKEDGLHIFVNFKKVGFIKSKNEALTLLRSLISNCPAEAKRDFEEFEEYLFRSLSNDCV